MSPGSAHTAGSPASAQPAKPVWPIGRRVRTDVHDARRSRSSSGCCNCAATERRGQDWLGPELGIPARTVGAILRRHQVPLLRECDPLTGEVIRASKATAVRYERPARRPGPHRRQEGRPHPRGRWLEGPRPQLSTAATTARGSATTTSTPRSTTTPGWPTPRSSTTRPDPPARRSCFGPPRFFASHGITVREVITDNAMNYTAPATSRPRSPASTPDTYHQAALPVAERQGRTLQPHHPGRVGLPQVYTSNDERTAALAPWLDYYNTRRRHSAIGGQPPISRLSPTS